VTLRKKKGKEGLGRKDVAGRLKDVKKKKQKEEESRF